MTKPGFWLIYVCMAALALSLTVVPAKADDEAMAAAKEIEGALAGGLRGLRNALATWEMNETAILDDTMAAIKTGSAFARFCLQPGIRHKYDVTEFAEIAKQCVESADEQVLETDMEARGLLGQAMVAAAEACLAGGAGDKSAALQDKALAHLEAVAAAEKPAAAALIDLGTLYTGLAAREPPKAEEWMEKALAVYGRVREVAGNSGVLCGKIAQMKVQLAEMREDALNRDPKDRKLKRAIEDTWEEALDSYKEALKLDGKNAELRTGYNETLWCLMRVKDGKVKDDPIMQECATRYRKVLFQVPDSNLWRIQPVAELEEDDDLFLGWKYNRKEGQGLTIIISHYRWDTNYVNPETNDTVGGDNIGGLADRSEADVRAYFQDIKERQPLRKMALSRYIRKAEGYMVKGQTKDGDLYEWRTWFFKNSKTQRTYRVTIIADLGMTERNPYELERVIESFRAVE